VSHGRLLGIARRLRSRAPMETLEESAVGRDVGVAGDSRGQIPIGRSTRRQVSVMSRECWDRANAELGTSLDWWLRRANLFVEGVHLPHRAGDCIAIGDEVMLEITGECDPCRRMDEIQPGLMAALTPEWRGGVLCRVIESGRIRIGDDVRIETL
jgi:MOSC domain-containing protein YiiM